MADAGKHRIGDLLDRGARVASAQAVKDFNGDLLANARGEPVEQMPDLERRWARARWLCELGGVKPSDAAYGEVLAVAVVQIEIGDEQQGYEVTKAQQFAIADTVSQAVENEREACAKIAESVPSGDLAFSAPSDRISEAIRARGAKEYASGVGMRWATGVLHHHGNCSILATDKCDCEFGDKVRRGEKFAGDEVSEMQTATEMPIGSSTAELIAAYNESVMGKPVPRDARVNGAPKLVTDMPQVPDGVTVGGTYYAIDPQGIYRMSVLGTIDRVFAEPIVGYLKERGLSAGNISSVQHNARDKAIRYEWEGVTIEYSFATGKWVFPAWV